MKKIINLFLVIFKIIDPRPKILFFVNIVFNFLSNLFQVIGLSSAIPFLSVLTNQNSIYENRYINFIYTYFKFEDPNEFVFFLGFFFLTLIILGNSLIGVSTFFQVYASQTVTKNLMTSRFQIDKFYYGI